MPFWFKGGLVGIDQGKTCFGRLVGSGYVMLCSCMVDKLDKENWY